MAFENPEINPHIYDQLIFNQGAKTIQWERAILFNTWELDNWISTCKRLNLDPYLTTYKNS